MRKLDENITPRALKVLEMVIHGYFQTGKPVGSRTIVRDFDLDCSPATVRNEMADLAEMGYLKQTHLSSGRVPTGKGVRLFLDTIMHEDKLSLLEIDRIRKFSFTGNEDFQSTVRNAGRVLADLTRQAGVVLMPGLKHSPLRHIEFTKLTSRRIVAIIVSEGGRFFNRVFEWGDEFRQSELTWAANYLNDHFKGKTLFQIREIVLKELREEKAKYDRMLGRALGLMQTVLESPLDEEVFIESRENLVETTEFSDSEKVLKFFKALQEKNLIVDLLSRALEESEPIIMLSTETGMEDVPELAIIIARYGDKGPGGGTLGILGPMRMNYPKLIPMVRYTAQYVSDLLTS